MIYLRERGSHEMSYQNLFVGIPETTLDSKKWKAFTPSARCVYITMLRKYYRKGVKANGRVKWKQDELVEASGLSLNTVKRSISELRQAGFIEIWEPGGRWLDGTEYCINKKWANW